MTTLANTVSQKSLTKTFIIWSMERKKLGQIQGRILIRRLVHNPTMQHIVINLHTKYNYSSLQKSLTKNFIIPSMERKKIGQKTGKNKQQKAGSQSHDIIYCHQSVYQIWLLLLARMVVEKSLTKNLRWRTEGRTDGRRDGWTDVNQYSPTFSKRGYKNNSDVSIQLKYRILFLLTVPRRRFGFSYSLLDFANVCSRLTLSFLTSSFDFLEGVLFETVALPVHL